MQVGVYGKLPCNGDFLRRRIPQQFLDWWDGWLQRGVQASRDELGEAWLDYFLTSPAWRFHFDAGEDDCTCTGLLVPSVDRVGRYFPLTLVWFPRGGRTIFSLARAAAPWFDAAERQVSLALESEQLDFDVFDRQISDTAALLQGVDSPDDFELQPPDAARLLAASPMGWRLPLARVTEMRAVAEHLAGAALRQAGMRCFFWSQGSDRVAPSLLMSAGSLAAADYASLLTGNWNASAWTSLDAGLHMPPPAEDTELRTALPLELGSAADSQVGHSRVDNQDAMLERRELGLWVVADGMGGHSDGQIASRMVCDSLADLLPPASLDEGVEAIRARLAAVNAYLFRMASRAVDPRKSGSTVATLLIRDGQCAIIWAGDSRVYRLRRGELRQLSEDHSWNGAGVALGAGDGTAITRAVGGEAELQLDVVHEDVLPGDRYLLCSDGVTRELGDVQLRDLLAADDASQSCRALMRAVLDTPARDNATAIVVDARLATLEGRDGAR